MPNKPFISLIIPIYNVEKYLRECLLSAANQTYKNYEVLMMDDGSTDGSSVIISEFLGKYENFRSSRAPGRGPGPARNLGISMARGEYLAFMDSDDVVAPEFLQILAERVGETGADIVMCNYSFMTRKNKLVPYPSLFRARTLPGKEALHTLIRDNSYHFFFWNKLFRKTLFIDNEIIQPAMRFEDITTLPKLFFHASLVDVIRNNKLYLYRIRKGSIMRSKNLNWFIESVQSLVYIRLFMDKTGVFNDYRHGFRWLVFKTLISVYFVMPLFFIKKMDTGYLKEMGRSIVRLHRIMKKSLPEGIEGGKDYYEGAAAKVTSEASV